MIAATICLPNFAEENSSALCSRAIAVVFFAAANFCSCRCRGQCACICFSAAREPNGFAMAAMRVSTYRKIKPSDWDEVCFYDHPSGYTRVHSSMLWLKENQDNATANGVLDIK